MSGNLAVRANGLGKRYLLNHQSSSARPRTIVEKISSLPTSIARLVSSGLFSGGSTMEEFWALKDVNFDVEVGSRIGIIGRNGAGKSTLLKVLSRITEPSTGTITMKGRVSSLLEVGTGFNPELSGRENIYLNGSILGMSRGEIKRKFDEIVDFSGVERFLDTPVKRYSSGMYVRLAFAVAAHLEPEILIVDEVLAVGDYSFQNKCLGKMEEVSSQGRTVLFVSHDMSAVSRLCEDVVVLDKGHLVCKKPTREAIQLYQSMGCEVGSVWRAETDNSSAEVTLTQVRILSESGSLQSAFPYDSSICFELSYIINHPPMLWTLCLRLTSFSGVTVFTSWSIDSLDVSQLKSGVEHKIRCWIPAKFLRPGKYNVLVGITRLRSAITFGGHIMSPTDLMQVEVTPQGYEFNLSRMGVITPHLEWEKD